MNRISAVKRLGRNSKRHGASHTITSVSDDGLGVAVFATQRRHKLTASRAIRITETSTGEYVGATTVDTVPTSSTFTTGAAFGSDATGDWDY